MELKLKTNCSYGVIQHRHTEEKPPPIPPRPKVSSPIRRSTQCITHAKPVSVAKQFVKFDNFRYFGSFNRNNKFHGHGIVTTNDNRILDTTFENGKIGVDADLTFPELGTFDVIMRNGKVSFPETCIAEDHIKLIQSIHKDPWDFSFTEL